MKVFFVDCFDTIQLSDRLNSPLTSFDKKNLYPFTCIKSCLDLRVGILTLREKWQKISLKFDIEIIDRDEEEEDVVWVSENIIPSDLLLDSILHLNCGEVLLKDGYILAWRFKYEGVYSWRELAEEVNLLKGIEDLFLLSGPEIRIDFNLLVTAPVKPVVSATNQLLGEAFYFAGNLHMECASLNSNDGPIYIDEDVTIMEGAHLRGPLYLGKGAVVKMGTTIYGNVSIGKQSVVGGEIGHSVIGDFSAKGHYGYLGCSVIGDWCNLGAGTSNSNLKNNLKTVSIYDYGLGGFRDTGLLKCGAFIGDFTRLGINSSLNTGTVIGIGSMLADTSFYAKFVPSFAWVFDGTVQSYEFDKFMEYLEALFASKNEELSERVKKELNQLNNT
ncbi:transferase [Sphingobacterium sp. N143]|uniref:putative sugar nucleotidyl transferase n=1 Tax=Sphingobacterium sp. N143 TaxID=2746727 RepID=UPI002574F02C|nr:putative sugar nucleotidyl transferase [Sphingobacterium sp. N143]MDM1296599.1 transferase [Sphingobacterium sp. N143]